MSFDLDGAVLEIAIALALVFFLLSLVVSALNEWVAALTKRRFKTLEKGLKGMLGDENVAKQLLGHPLVRNDLPNKNDHAPSYIAPSVFAAAFRELIDITSDGENRKATVRVQEEDGRTRPREVSGSLERQLETLTGASSAALPSVKALEKWFDESMDRVSGWYTRKAQIWSVVLATIAVLVLNVNTARIVDVLAEQPAVRAAVVAKAEAVADETPPEEIESAEDESQAAAQMKQAGKDMETTVDDLAALKLPLFWADEKNRPDFWEEWVVAAIGWLISIVAVSLGAPFWFDTLNRLTNLRMAGKKPEEKPAGT